MNKHLKLSLVIAGVLAAGNAAAFAPQWPADGDDTNGNDPAGSVVIWHSGASASNLSVQSAVISTFCDTAQPVTLLENSSASSGSRADFWTVACQTKSTLSANLQSRKLLWNKRNEGGSGVGVQPVATSAPIAFMKPATGAGAENCPTAPSLVRVIAGINVNVHTCSNFVVGAASTVGEADATADRVIRVPDIGTADIEADKFTFTENKSESDLDLNGTRPDTITNSAAGLTQEPLAQLLFGVYGNLYMIQDLQRAQFPAGHPDFERCNPSGTLYLREFNNEGGPNVAISDPDANANRERCMPSLSSNEIRGIFANLRAIREANDFQRETAFQSGAYVQMAATDGTNNLPSQSIIACRRVRGSGTQAQFNVMRLGYPCDPTNDGAIDTLVPAFESFIAGNFQSNIRENESSGDVDNCVTDFQNGTNVTGKNPTSTRSWAIGLGSLERNSISSGALSGVFRFFKIDGFAPTLVNAHAGDYGDFAQQVLLKRASVSTGAVADAFTALTPALSTPQAAFDLRRQHAFGTSGWLAAPRTGVTPTTELDLATSTSYVNWFRRESNGNKPNTCALPSPVRPGTTSGITVAPQNCSSDNGSGDQNCYTP